MWKVFFLLFMVQQDNEDSRYPVLRKDAPLVSLSYTLLIKDKILFRSLITRGGGILSKLRAPCKSPIIFTSWVILSRNDRRWDPQLRRFSFRLPLVQKPQVCLKWILAGTPLTRLKLKFFTVKRKHFLECLHVASNITLFKTNDGFPNPQTAVHPHKTLLLSLLFPSYSWPITFGILKQPLILRCFSLTCCFIFFF